MLHLCLYYKSYNITYYCNNKGFSINSPSILVVKNLNPKKDTSLLVLTLNRITKVFNIELLIYSHITKIYILLFKKYVLI